MVTPARVVVVSATIQEFLGERFYLCGRYFQRQGRRLHRAVWENHHGPIPPGMEVHHADHDRANNRLENLKLLVDSEHASHHSSRPSEVQRAARRRNQEKTAAWHRTEAGKRWHSEHAAASWAKRKPVKKTCANCGEIYETLSPKTSKFCHPNCRQAALRSRRRAQRGNRKS